MPARRRSVLLVDDQELNLDILEEALGDRFDIRAFHDELLSAGAVPMDVLEARMRRWVARQQEAAH